MKRIFAGAGIAGNALVGVAILCLLGVVVWHFFDPAIAPPPRDVAQRTHAAMPAVPEAPADYAEIAAWHLFGKADAAAEPEQLAEIVVLDALPESTVKLTVTGTVASGAGKAGRAIIMGPSGQQREYKIGDTLPGNVQLHRVEPTRIVIRRNGVLEAIALPRHEELLPAAGRKNAAGTRSTDPAPLAVSQTH
jgi:type II secretory pathway component PulC